MPVAEAEAMDPQQRMALECSYEAYENGIFPSQGKSLRVTDFLLSWYSYGERQRHQYFLFHWLLHD